jgi:alkanal monooxygenase alpha chain
VTAPTPHIFLTLAQVPGWTSTDTFDLANILTAEALGAGYEGAWLLEHHFSQYGLCPSALTMAGFLLGRFPTLRITTGVTVLPNVHPIHVAEQAAMLDHLSQGRLALGIGRGIFVRDFDIFARGFGIRPENSHVAMREAIELIERAWSAGAAGGEGPFYTFEAVPVHPKPRDRGPPIYVAAESPSTVEWAASRGYNMALGYWLAAETIRSNLELYAMHAEQAGRDPSAAAHAVSCIAHVEDTTEIARSVVEPHLTWWREEGFRIGFSRQQLSEMKNYQYHATKGTEILLREKKVTGRDARTLIDLNPIGSADHCIECLERALAGTGIRHIVCAVEASGDRSRILENVNRFKSSVLDRLSL